jgi:hypothetical protein
MATARPRWHPFRFLVSALVLSSCASGPPPGPSPAQIAGQEANTIIVASFNIVSPLPPDLEGSTRKVSMMLIEYLEAHDKKVYLLESRAAHDLWKMSMKAVRESGLPQNFKNAARVYAHEIGEQLEFDVVIVPSIITKYVRKKQSRTIRSDGAEQTLEYRGNSRGVAISSINIKAASLFVQIIDREGNAIHTKRAGLELIQHLQFGGQHVKGSIRRTDSDAKLISSWKIVNDVPPIENDAMLRAGVAAAFSPFLPEIESVSWLEDVD